ncbi:hypothetical protein FACS1894163_05160 [Spirochaetia bacterium]|nr:hypothetical protein FACS1894163_05160 [Spirochaetia bacterium]
MKYVYVLTCSENDLYYEQFFLSVTSLRLYNTEAVIIVLLDGRTKAVLSGKRTGYEHIVSEIKIIPVPEEFSQKESSRWIKTSINDYVDGNFLFIDCDTVITGSLEYDFPPDIKIGAILDNHTMLQDHRIKDHIIKENIDLNFTYIKKRQNYFNSGVIYFQESPESIALFKKWHELWLLGLKRGCSQDQPAFNQADYELGNIISIIGGEWNCQIGYGGLQYFANAKIIHYFSTELSLFAAPYSLASNKILSSIKESGIIDDTILLKIKNPFSEFEPNARIFSDIQVLSIINSSIFSNLLWLKRNHTHIFYTIDSIIAKTAQVVKTLFIRKEINNYVK